MFVQYLAGALALILFSENPHKSKKIWFTGGSPPPGSVNA